MYMRIKTLFGIALLFAVLGLLNAGFVYVRVQSGGPLPCFVVSGCDVVQASSYAYLFGVPLSLWGALYYALIAFSSLFLFIISSRAEWNIRYIYILRAWFLLVAFGFLFSWYLFALQAFIIGAFCSSCLFSLIDVIFITASAIVVRRRTRIGVPGISKP